MGFLTTVGDGLASAGRYLFGGNGSYDAIGNVIQKPTTGIVNTGLTWLGNYKDGLAALGGLTKGYFDYQANRQLQRLAQQQINDARDEAAYNRNREAQQEANMATGFTTGYLDRRKRRELGLAAPTTP